MMDTPADDRVIASVDRQLIQWARWQTGILGEGLGYQSLLSRYQKREVGGGPVESGDPAFDRRMLDIDRAVAGLISSLRRVVMVEYVHGHWMSAADRAQKCHISEKTYSRRLQLALEEIALALGSGVRV